MMHFVFRLQPQVRAQFAADREAIGFRSPIIGMHIRRGDKCRGARGPGIPPGLCTSIQPFLRAAERLRAEYGVASIFLASDDPGALDACRTGGQFRCIAFHDELRGNNSVRSRTRAALLNNSAATLAVMREVDTLAHCDFFIGTLGRSAVSTFSYELLVARRGGEHVPFVSFGSWAWGMGGGFA